MSNAIASFLRKIEVARRAGNDTEHTHRPALKALLETLDPRVHIVNEPRRIACGAPDLVVLRASDSLALGHVEAKDIDTALSEALKTEQIMKLSWNKLHVQSRQEICWGACASEKLATKSWQQLDEWLHSLLANSVAIRSKGRLQLRA